MMNYYTPVTSYSSCERKEKHGWNDLTLGLLHTHPRIIILLSPRPPD